MMAKGQVSGGQTSPNGSGNLQADRMKRMREELKAGEDKKNGTSESSSFDLTKRASDALKRIGGLNG